jgi:hypothetical protein
MIAGQLATKSYHEDVPLIGNIKAIFGCDKDHVEQNDIRLCAE